MEYYSSIKKNEIMPFAATWIDLKIVILREVSQTEKEKYHMISLINRMLKKIEIKKEGRQEYTIGKDNLFNKWC